MCKTIWKKENLITFLEIILLVIGIKYCYSGNILVAMAMLIFLGICDGFDGYFAKKFRKGDGNKEYGIQLDSLADIMSSGLFPVIICISMGFTNIIDFIVYAIFLICGITRLTYYNVNTSKGANYFSGVPITVSTMILPLLFVITKNEIVYMLVLAALSILYVCNFKIKKPNLKQKIILAILGIIIVIVIAIKEVCFI